MTVILWFKRDLRVFDHPALVDAAQRGSVLPLYIIEPEYWAQPDTSGRQFAFLKEALADLAQQLEHLNVSLCVRVGDACQVLEAVRAETGADTLISHEETGNYWTYQRDLAVGKWAQTQGVNWIEHSQSGVVRRLGNRDVWARQRNAYVSSGCLPTPSAIEAVTLRSDPIPDLTPKDVCPERQTGGRAEGRALLGSFLEMRGETYRRDMSSPLKGAVSCSRVSPYLALGCLSVREVAHAAQQTGRTVDWAKSLKSFQSRLAWRDHFMQKLEDEPTLEWQVLHSAYAGMRGDDPFKRKAWEEGRTGLPFVDACMRSLRATGWLNFRMRSMLMAVASYHLWLDWRLTGLHLARQFTDYEPGIHWSQVQMQSGTTGINTIRIYNPIKQGHDQDPNGIFTRQWVPELSVVPNEYLQEPWLWPGASSLAYPEPILDVAMAARSAREAIHAVRRQPDFRNEASLVIKKHASRKDRQRHFVNDRARSSRKSKNDPRQSSFDL